MSHQELSLHTREEANKEQLPAKQTCSYSSSSCFHVIAKQLQNLKKSMTTHNGDSGHLKKSGSRAANHTSAV
jgi:hypothetical protein